MPSYTKTISNLTPALGVILYWRPESSDTADSSTGSVNMDGTYTVSFSYEYGITYVWSLYYYENSLATTKIDGGTVYTASPPTYSLSCGITNVTANISNLSSGSSVVFRVLNQVTGNIIGSSSGTANGASMSLTVSGLSSNTTYTAQVLVDGTSIGYTDFTTKYEEFKWDTNIYKGAKMNVWQNPANGTTRPAPVTAAEWNRLVSLVNQKCGTNIATVSSGKAMTASSGGNIRLVADALGVSVSGDSIVTAQFFLDLRDTVNAL